MHRFDCRIEFLAVKDEARAMLIRGMNIKDVYKKLLQVKKINMSYLQFYRYCKGKVKGIKSCFEEEKVTNNTQKDTTIPSSKPLAATETVKLMEDKQAYF